MNRPRFSPLQTIPILAVLCTSTLFAQEMHQHAPSVPSKSLTVRSSDGKTLTLNPQELAALPHKSVAVFNAHTKANETYSGVPLASLLDRVGAPLGEKVHGAVLMTGVVAEGTDGYKVLFALAEVDTAFHNGDVFVADSMDGHPLGEDGAFKLVSTEDKRPARRVRNLITISIFNAKR